MKKKHTGLIVFLVILAIIILIPVVTYIYLSKSSFEIDDIYSIPGRPTLSETERFRVDAAADTMDIRLNKSDTAYIVIDVMDLDELKTELAEYDIVYDRIGLSVDDGYVALEFNAMWKGFLPLPVRVCFDPVAKGTDFEFKLEKICLGPKLRLGGSILRFIGDVAEVTADMTDYCSIFTNMVAADADKDILSVTVAEPLKWLTKDTVDSMRMTFWNEYIGTDPLEELILAIENGDTETRVKWLKDIEAYPDSFSDLKEQELVYSTNLRQMQFFLDEGGEMFERLFPRLEQSAVVAKVDERKELVAERRRQLCSVAHEIAELYCKKGIATDGAQFYNLKAKKEPLAISQFSRGAEVEEWLDTSTLRFVYGHVTNHWLDEAPALKKIPVIGKHAFDNIDESKVYLPYMVFISPADRPVMAFESALGNITLYDISWERYESIMASEWTPFIDQRRAPI